MHRTKAEMMPHYLRGADNVEPLPRRDPETGHANPDPNRVPTHTDFEMRGIRKSARLTLPLRDPTRNPELVQILRDLANDIERIGRNGQTTIVQDASSMQIAVLVANRQIENL
jgi:hypothetical protein